MSAGVPKKEPSYIHMRKNIRSPSAEPHADGMATYNVVWPGSTRREKMCLNTPKFSKSCNFLLRFTVE
jgi:hypothetical protein